MHDDIMCMEEYHFVTKDLHSDKEIKGRWKVNPSMFLVCLTKTVTYLELCHSKRILHGCV